jgi:NCAIR mutase (PurE)-related protein
VLAVIFSTGLAPIAGDYGIIFGIIAGMIHLPVNISLSQLHGGVLLYSNGFAAAFTAVIINTIVQTFRRREMKWLYTRR